MRSKDIKIHEYYRHRNSPDYGYIKPLKILKPKEYPNIHNFIVVKCEHVVYKDDTSGFVKYFRLFDIENCK